MLDEALEQTFPASDPVALQSCVERAGGEDPCAATGSNGGRAPARTGRRGRARARVVR
jgi:hypothetical protein